MFDDYLSNRSATRTPVETHGVRIGGSISILGSSGALRDEAVVLIHTVRKAPKSDALGGHLD